MATLLGGEHRPWTGVLGPQAVRIPGRIHEASIFHQFGQRRCIIAECLRPSRPFQQSPIPEPKPELLTPSAALVEAETQGELLAGDQQIAYLRNLVARLSQYPAFSDKVKN